MHVTVKPVTDTQIDSSVEESIEGSNACYSEACYRHTDRQTVQ